MSEGVIRQSCSTHISHEGSADEGMHIFGPEGGRHACKPAPSVYVDVFVYMVRPFQY